MYKAFSNSNPLPRDGNLIDYGIEDDDLLMDDQNKNNDKMQ